MTYIWSHTELSDPLAQRNEDIGQLVKENMLETSTFHLKKHSISTVKIKKKFSSPHNKPRNL